VLTSPSLKEIKRQIHLRVKTFHVPFEMFYALFYGDQA
jgi:hypothetical protein